MTEDNEKVEAATERLHRRLVKVGQLRRQQARVALGPLKRLTEEAASALVEEGRAVRQVAPQGSWTLSLAGRAAALTAPTAPLGLHGERATLRYGESDQTGVVYQLADALLKECVEADGTRNYDRVFVETRAAVARLLELQRLDVATATRKALGHRNPRSAPRG